MGVYEKQKKMGHRSVSVTEVCCGTSCVLEVLCVTRTVLQIASLPNYIVLMKACTPGGPAEDRLGTSPVLFKRGKRVTTHTRGGVINRKE